uniref:Uncharacterized protein n=1 Tax=Populus davidiana TaxID=266767 RepID=A0A6M2F245_9ROSI
MRHWDIQFSLSVNLSLSAPHLNELAGYEIPLTLLASYLFLDTLLGINRPPLALPPAQHALYIVSQHAPVKKLIKHVTRFLVQSFQGSIYLWSSITSVLQTALQRDTFFTNLISHYFIEHTNNVNLSGAYHVSCNLFQGKQEKHILYLA